MLLLHFFFFSFLLEFTGQQLSQIGTFVERKLDPFCAVTIHVIVYCSFFFFFADTYEDGFLRNVAVFFILCVCVFVKKASESV